MSTQTEGTTTTATTPPTQTSGGSETIPTQDAPQSTPNTAAPTGTPQQPVGAQSLLESPNPNSAVNMMSEVDRYATMDPAEMARELLSIRKERDAAAREKSELMEKATRAIAEANERASQSTKSLQSLETEFRERRGQEWETGIHKEVKASWGDETSELGRRMKSAFFNPNTPEVYHQMVKASAAFHERDDRNKKLEQQLEEARKDADRSRRKRDLQDMVLGDPALNPYTSGGASRYDTASQLGMSGVGGSGLGGGKESMRNAPYLTDYGSRPGTGSVGAGSFMGSNPQSHFSGLDDLFMPYSQGGQDGGQSYGGRPAPPPSAHSVFEPPASQSAPMQKARMDSGSSSTADLLGGVIEGTGGQQTVAASGADMTRPTYTPSGDSLQDMIFGWGDSPDFGEVPQSKIVAASSTPGRRMKKGEPIIAPSTIKFLSEGVCFLGQKVWRPALPEPNHAERASDPNWHDAEIYLAGRPQGRGGQTQGMTMSGR